MIRLRGVEARVHLTANGIPDAQVANALGELPVQSRKQRKESGESATMLGQLR